LSIQDSFKSASLRSPQFFFPFRIVLNPHRFAHPQLFFSFRIVLKPHHFAHPQLFQVAFKIV
jgi:hypothetical protein